MFSTISYKDGFIHFSVTSNGTEIIKAQYDNRIVYCASVHAAKLNITARMKKN
jgi:hypothetical protein